MSNMSTLTPSALYHRRQSQQVKSTRSTDETGVQEQAIYLRATKTLNARSATVPNTFLKNKAATVTPEDSISAYHNSRINYH